MIDISGKIRDFEKNPYSRDEQRVCDYIQQITKSAIGCGDDPIGFLMASHNYLSQRYKELTKDQPIGG